MPRKLFLCLIATFLLTVFAPVTAAGSSTHTVQTGETLWSIARENHTTVATLAEKNNINNRNLIFKGQTLLLPGSTSNKHTVQRGDTLWLIARKNNVSLASLLAVNSIKNKNLIEPGQTITIPSLPASRAGRTNAPAVSFQGHSFNAGELDLFARLVYSEAAGEPFKGQVAVAASVLNRMRSSKYPNTLQGVIYQVVGGFYQYSPVLDGRINLPASDSAHRAVQEAINGWDPSGGATGFFNPRKTSNRWVRSQPVTLTINNHIFFRY